MKPKPSLRNLRGVRALFLASLLSATHSAQGQTTYFWDANGGSSGTGGNGLWTTDTSLWRNGTATGALSTWPNTTPNTDYAQLAGTAGTVTLNSGSENINFNRIIFGVTGYQISGPETGTATLNLSGSSPRIETGASIIATISANISGATGFNKTGAGTLNLSGTNTYTGTTTISSASTSGGVVNVSGDHSAANGGWTINGDSTVNFLSGSTIGLAAGRKITLANSNSSTGFALNVYGSVNATSTSELEVRGRRTLNLESGAAWTHSGIVEIQPLNTSYAATMNVKTGSSFTYNGTSSITLAKSSSNASGNASLNLSGGTFTTSRTISNSAAGTGSGTTTLSFSNGGTLKISNNVTSLLTQGSTNFAVTTSGVAGGVIDTNGFSTAIAMGISGTGAFTKAGGGMLTFSGTHTYTGSTTISEGTLRLGAGGTTGGLTGTSSITNNGILSINRSNAFSQAIDLNGKLISGSGSFTQAGTGTTTLSGVNSYTGATTVTSGSLVIDGGSLANTAISVNNPGSMLALRPAAGTINLGTNDEGSGGATLTLANGTSFSMVDGAIGTVNLQQQISFAESGLTMSGGASFHFEVGTAAADQFRISKGATVVDTNLINIAALAPLVGPYDLITAEAGLNGGTFHFGGSGTTLQTLAIGTNAYPLTLGSSATAVTLSVGAATPITGVTWTGQTNGTGDANSNWDNSVSTNWAANTTACAVSLGTAVTFGDTNAANSDAPITNSIVTITSSGVFPASTTFNNSAVNYTVDGGSIGGTGSIIKTGTGSVTLTNSHSYSGNTTVTGGLLVLAANNAGNDASTVTIGASGLLQLTYVGTDTVDKLFIGETQQAPGIYGHSTSGATNGGLGVGAFDARFAEGTGTLTVTSGPVGPTFDTFMADYPGLTGNNALPGADPDADGLSNIAEFIMGGTAPDSANAANPPLEAVSNGYMTLSILVPADATFAGSPSPSTIVQGVQVAVSGSLELSTFDRNVEETQANPTIPAAPTGYEWHTFRLSAPISSQARGFLRAAFTKQ